MFWSTDAHCDTAARVAGEGLDFFAAGETPLHITSEKLAAGDVRLQVMACFCGGGGVGPEARRLTDAALDACDEMQRRGARFLTSLHEQPPEGVHLLRAIEGGEALRGDPEALERYFARGVRLLTLTWNHENELGHGSVTGGDAGLKPFGKAMVRRMVELGMAVDVSHLNVRGFWDVADLCGPFVASHSCVRALHDHPRNLHDDQIDRIIASGGFIGINFYPAFLTGAKADVRDVARHIDTIAQRGGARAVGLGSDFDGIESCPEGLEGPQCLPALFEELRAMGYSDAAIQDIAGANLWRVLRSIQGVAA